ncbi:metallophosphoesterase [Asanoa sp. WMMD1127]|uniref:metallophosphoesterase family protein n=1 Tax=Asanoa sp. WMMD1127 TaxID=3016107 RepID=UPI002415B7AF|nr:metallophosphoesterase [Asanoa sp. WMMD1127]MDG4820363.1 metallophosphoesterase [Asanoa sp. WMMD1127]
MHSEPYLLDPSADGVHVLWHTGAHATGAVLIGGRRVEATSSALVTLHDDQDVRTTVHRHWALVTGLGAAARTPYRVVSDLAGGDRVESATYSLAPAVPPGRPARLLLSSDHQMWRMTPANIEKVAETVGVELDGVLFAGDMVGVPDRAADWFDPPRGFFASLTGRADTEIAGRRYRGAPLLQHTPLFPAIGNHEVMGRRARHRTLQARFDDPAPDAWDTATYEALFPVPRGPDGPRWWSRTVGDVFVVALFVTRAWRDAVATYAEPPDRAGDPMGGQFRYARVDAGSPQYGWLAGELASPAARAARYRVVLFHHASHGLGAHCVPAYTDPVPDGAGGYAYPIADDVVLRDLAPLFAAAGVDLVVNGHSHLWNRFRDPAGVNWLETSNVGNSYGAFPDRGDPGGLAAVMPTVAPLAGPDGAPLPYVADNDVTVFSVLDSGAGVVRSYRFDTRHPDGPVVLFDELPLERNGPFLTLSAWERAVPNAELPLLE